MRLIVVLILALAGCSCSHPVYIATAKEPPHQEETARRLVDRLVSFDLVRPIRVGLEEELAEEYVFALAMAINDLNQRVGCYVFVLHEFASADLQVRGWKRPADWDDEKEKEFRSDTGAQYDPSRREILLVDKNRRKQVVYIYFYHELGHAAGLAHSDEKPTSQYADVMYVSAGAAAESFAEGHTWVGLSDYDAGMLRRQYCQRR